MKEKKGEKHRNQSNVVFCSKTCNFAIMFMLIVQKPLRYLLTLFKKDILT